MTTTETEQLAPAEPESLEETGLSGTLLHQLIVKILYFRGDLYGQDLCRALGLKYSVIQDTLDWLILQHQVQIKRSLGVGHVAALMTLTESGRARAREYIEANQYAGPAPVPVAQYAEMVRRQRPREGWLSKEALRRAFSSIVVSERTLSQLGPAVSSANSLLIYGKPGDGKTYLVETLNRLESTPIFVPHALECQGNIIQLFDPIYHEPLAEEEPSVLAIAVERAHDRRWIRCKRPFIVSGGELSLDMLDLRFNESSKIYEAPFQLKANNGLYLIDDFGRQRATPAEVLNRWIVPMERRVDYLSFLTGGKITVPFETFLVFSTNLNPSDLGDEAFLRRIQYKMLLRGPDENEFVRIFEQFCESRQVDCPPALLERLLNKRYRNTGRPMRRCHPRDLLSHALNLVHFEKLAYELSEELLDRAFESCFLEEGETAPMERRTAARVAAPVSAPAPAPAHREAAAHKPAPAKVASQTCATYWGGRIAQSPTVFGALQLLASLRAGLEDFYEEPTPEREFGAEETSVALSRLHAQVFRQWLGLRLSEKMRDLRQFAAAPGNRERIAAWQGQRQRLAPASATESELGLFDSEFSTLMKFLAGENEEAPAPGRMQKIA